MNQSETNDMDNWYHEGLPYVVGTITATEANDMDNWYYEGLPYVVRTTSDTPPVGGTGFSYGFLLGI